MKPTNTQKIVCDAVIDQLQFWKGTNDMDPSTHYCNIDEQYALLDKNLSKAEIARLASITRMLFRFIKNLAI